MTARLLGLGAALALATATPALAWDPIKSGVSAKNAQGQLLAIERRSEGFQITLTVPNDPAGPVQLWSTDLIVNTKDADTSDRSVSLMYGDIFFELEHLIPPQYQRSKCFLDETRSEAAKEACAESRLRVEGDRVIMVLPPAEKWPAANQMIATLEKAKVVRVSYRVPNERKLAVFAVAGGASAKAALAPAG